MYKITNKKSGFIQYRNAEETASFVFRNNQSNYIIEQMSEFDLTKYENFIYGALIVTILVLTFFLLQFSS